MKSALALSGLLGGGGGDQDKLMQEFLQMTALAAANPFSYLATPPQSSFSGQLASSTHTDRSQSLAAGGASQQPQFDIGLLMNYLKQYQTFATVGAQSISAAPPILGTRSSLIKTL